MTQNNTVSEPKILAIVSCLKHDTIAIVSCFEDIYSNMISWYIPRTKPGRVWYRVKDGLFYSLTYEEDVNRMYIQTCRKTEAGPLVTIDTFDFTPHIDKLGATIGKSFLMENVEKKKWHWSEFIRG